MLFQTIAAFVPAFGPISPAPHDCENCPGPGQVWRVDAGQNSMPQTGKDWAHAFRDLQAAIDIASAGDCIWVAAGRYTPTAGTDRSLSFTIDKSLYLYGGFDGSEACWSERGNNYSGTRLQGDIGVTGDSTDNSYHVVQIFILHPIGSPSGKVVIDGFSIRDGYNDQQAGNGNGSGITLTSTKTHLDLRNCTVRDNRSFGHGAGLYVENGSFNVSLSKFSSNAAGGGSQPADGGALWASMITKDCLLHNVEFKNNSATRNGGAFFGKHFGNFTGTSNWLRFANGLFHGNTADKGGAGYVADRYASGLRAQADLTNCTLSANSASTDGAALFAEQTHPSPEDNGRLYLFDTIVWGNVTPADVIAAFETAWLIKGDSQLLFSVFEPQDGHWVCAAPGTCFTSPACPRFACDPLFVGTTFRLSANSPAIDEVSSTQTGALPADSLDLDGDGDKGRGLALGPRWTPESLSERLRRHRLLRALEAPRRRHGGEAAPVAVGCLATRTAGPMRS